MHNEIQVSASPHIWRKNTTRGIMLDVCIALLPAVIASVWFFGFRALSIILVSVLSAVVFEFIYQKIAHTKTTVNDFSAVLTGLLLALNLPVSVPYWVAVFGSGIAIVLVKQLFGGLGSNFMNPALTARAFLFVSFSTIMSHYPEPSGAFGKVAIDAMASVTPLSMSHGSVPLLNLFLGNVPGVLGETSKLALIIGGCYLLIRGVINWRIPTLFIVSSFLCFFLKGGVDFAVYQILSGGLFLGAIFMATDYVTAPITPIGQWIMGIGCGILLFVMRTYSAFPEGCSFAILLMNIATPLIDRFTLPVPFGKEKSHV